jgi:GTP-binding protein
MKSSETFIDEIEISVFAGNGGDGSVSFRREKFVPFGGPDGGDGGRGGDVILVADRNLVTLNEHRRRRENQAESGVPGSGSNKDGRNGSDLEIRVPVGTLAYDLDESGREKLLVDLEADGDRMIVAKGGRGGRGNAQFATSTRQAPDFAERGQPGQIRKLRLALKILADVGLVGYPNAGKSTLLSRISGARPRIAAYPFTTLVPALGVAEVDERRFVVADIPGLIEGASDGAGLGFQFLRHIERTRVLVHLIDAGAAVLEGRDLLAGYDAIRAELGAFEPSLLERPEIVVLNKVDLVADRESLAPLLAAFRERGVSVQPLSGATGEGLASLLREVARALDAVEALADGEAEARECGT